MQNAILEKNEEEFKKYISDDETLVVGDSNLGEFYNYTLDNLNQEALIDWDSFDIRDIDVHFSSDMTMAYLTFMLTEHTLLRNQVSLLIIIQEHLLFGLELVMDGNQFMQIGCQRLMELEFHNNRQLFAKKLSLSAEFFFFILIKKNSPGIEEMSAENVKINPTLVAISDQQPCLRQV